MSSPRSKSGLQPLSRSASRLPSFKRILSKSPSTSESKAIANLASGKTARDVSSTHVTSFDEDVVRDEFEDDDEPRRESSSSRLSKEQFACPIPPRKLPPAATKPSRFCVSVEAVEVSRSAQSWSVPSLLAARREALLMRGDTARRRSQDIDVRPGTPLDTALSSSLASHVLTSHSSKVKGAHALMSRTVSFTSQSGGGPLRSPPLPRVMHNNPEGQNCREADGSLAVMGGVARTGRWTADSSVRGGRVVGGGGSGVGAQSGCGGGAQDSDRSVRGGKAGASALAPVGESVPQSNDGVGGENHSRLSEWLRKVKGMWSPSHQWGVPGRF